MKITGHEFGTRRAGGLLPPRQVWFAELAPLSILGSFI